MKRIIQTAALAALLTSCVQDLDTLPLDKTEPVAEYVYGTSPKQSKAIQYRYALMNRASAR